MTLAKESAPVWSEWIHDKSEFVVPTSSTSLIHEWEKVCETDNEERAMWLVSNIDRSLMTASNFKLLQLSVNYKPFPEKSLSVWMKKSEAYSNWISDITAGADTDWDKVLGWWMQQDYISLDMRTRALAQGFTKAVSSLKYSSDDSFIQAALRLDQNAADRATTNVSQLFLLSVIHPSSFSWIEPPSSEKLTQGITESMLSASVSAIVWGTKKDDPKEAWHRFNNWLDKDPLHHRVWSELQQKDTIARTLIDDWISIWLPNSTYKDSPMDLWDKRSSSKVWSGSPFDHPLFKGIEGALSEVSGRIDISSIYRNLISHFNDLPSSSSQCECVLALLKWKKESFLFVLDDDFGDESTKDFLIMFEALKSSPIGSWQNIPVHLLSIGVSHSSNWIHLAAQTSQGSKELGEVLKDPRSLEQLATNFEVSSLLRWAQAQPYWNTWRNNEGDSLLQAFFNASHKNSTAPKLKGMTFSFLSNLYAQDKNWLLNENFSGYTILDENLGLSETQKSRLRHKALSSIPSISKGKRCQIKM